MAHKKTLFLIGAGFSANYSQATHQIDNLKPPMNDTFFPMLKLLLEKTQSNSENEIEHLLQYLCKSKGLPYHFDRQFLNNYFKDMEEIITDLSIQTSLFESSNKSKINNNFNTLIELIAYTFGRTLYGPVQQDFIKFTKLLEPNDVIITFNYDLLLEKSLMHINKFNPNGYQIEYYKYLENGLWQKEQKESKIKIYKLHGSINWLKCKECDTLMINDPEEFNRNSFDCKNIDTVKCPKCGEINSLFRLIIPPIQSKNYNEHPFRFLWRNAGKEIQDIRRIASLGYRIPSTDYTTKSLLRSILKNIGNEEIKLLTMNRSHSAEDEYKKLLPNIIKPLRSTNILDFLTEFKKL